MAIWHTHVNMYTGILRHTSVYSIPVSRYKSISNTSANKILLYRFYIGIPPSSTQFVIYGPSLHVGIQKEHKVKWRGYLMDACYWDPAVDIGSQSKW